MDEPSLNSKTITAKDAKEAAKAEKIAAKAAKVAASKAACAAQVAAANAAFDANAAEAYKNVEGSIIWSATLDRETRPSHGMMDGKKRNADGFFDGPGKYRTPYPGWSGLPAEERDGCRCSLSFEVKGYKPELRRTREDGIIPYVTWSKWAKSKGWTKAQGWPKEEIRDDSVEKKDL
jgi:hypothetical protein